MKWDNFVQYVWSNRTKESEIILCTDTNKIIFLKATLNFICILQKYDFDHTFRFVDNGDGYWAIFGK